MSNDQFQKHKMLIEINKKFENYCDHNNINYSRIEGTDFYDRENQFEFEEAIEAYKIFEYGFKSGFFCLKHEIEKLYK